jgi:hypothetical protein
MAMQAEKKLKGRCAVLTRGEDLTLVAHAQLYQPESDRPPGAKRLEASLDRFEEQQLWTWAKVLSHTSGHGLLQGEGGRQGRSPITAKSGTYAVKLLDELESLVDGLLQASSTSAILITLARKGDLHEKCHSFFMGLEKVIRINGKRVVFENFEAVWKACELGCVSVEFDPAEAQKMEVEPLAYASGTLHAGQFRASQKLLKPHSPCRPVPRFSESVGDGLGRFELFDRRWLQTRCKGQKCTECCLDFTCLLGEAQKQRIQSPGTECRRESHIPALQGVAFHGREKVS